jgi:hypothetical protein
MSTENVKTRKLPVWCKVLIILAGIIYLIHLAAMGITLLINEGGNDTVFDFTMSIITVGGLIATFLAYRGKAAGAWLAVILSLILPIVLLIKEPDAFYMMFSFHGAFLPYIIPALLLLVNASAIKRHKKSDSAGIASLILAGAICLGLTACDGVESDAKKLAKLQHKVYELTEQKSKIAGNVVSDLFGVLSGTKSASRTETAKLVKELQELSADLDKFKIKLETKYSAEELQQLLNVAAEELEKLNKSNN